jgi:hypothetical protein
MLDGSTARQGGLMVTPCTRRWACAWCLGAAVTAGVGCGRPLCPAIAFPAEIYVSLAPDWPSTDDLVLTVSCPPRAECGFHQGPVSGPANDSVLLVTVLRPPEIDVAVSSASSGAVVHEQRLEVPYEPIGDRQSDCSTEAQALLTVPAG